MAKKKSKINKLDEITIFDQEQDLSFPDICKFIRKTLNVTQEQMAQKLNITTTAYGYWEYGKYVPKGWQAFNLCFLYLHAKEQANKQNSQENSSEESTSISDKTDHQENQAA